MKLFYILLGILLLAALKPVSASATAAHGGTPPICILAVP